MLPWLRVSEGGPSGDHKSPGEGSGFPAQRPNAVQARFSLFAESPLEPPPSPLLQKQNLFPEPPQQTSSQKLSEPQEAHKDKAQGSGGGFGWAKDKEGRQEVRDEAEVGDKTEEANRPAGVSAEDKKEGSLLASSSHKGKGSVRGGAKNKESAILASSSNKGEGSERGGATKEGRVPAGSSYKGEGSGRGGAKNKADKQPAGPAEKNKKMVGISGPPEAVRRAVAVELLLSLLGIAASSAALYFVMKKLDPNAAAAKIAKQKKREIARRLGRPMIQTNQYEDIIACDVINPENIEVTFDSIGGLGEVKKSLHELIILPLLRPELFSRNKLLRPQKGVLLFGPPGTGKTLLAKAVARECSAAFINVRVANLMSKWFGDAQKLVAAVFTLAHKLQPAIIFIDEIDSILGQRKQTDHEAITSMKTEFMSLWDGFSTDDHARVMVLCATNRPWDLDEAILRRLPRSFEIPLPDKAGRENILRVILRGEMVDSDFSYAEVADLTEGYSGSDLMELCKQAAYFPLRRLLDDEKEVDALGGRIVGQQPQTYPLMTSDFKEALKESPPAKEAAEEYRRRWQGNQAGHSRRASSSAANESSVPAEQFLPWALALSRLLNQNAQNGDANERANRGDK